jgi:FkbH-like protein
LISDSNLDIFSAYLNNDEEHPVVQTTAAPFGQVAQTLMQEDAECWKDNPDFAVIWTRPEGIVSSFGDLLAYKTPSTEEIYSEVEQFASLILNAADKTKFIFVPTWVMPPFHRGFGMLDMKKDIGIANTLMRMNLILSEKFADSSNIFMFDTQKWINTAPKYAFNPKLWYRGKVAFGNDVYKEAVRDIKAALNGIKGHSKKIVIVDLDDTLWGGIVGDAGWENLVLGGHNPAGEAYVDFQHALKSLTNRGILLGIVSKNEESVALEAFKNHPEMVLKLEDFAGWKINWQDKAQNIIDLVSDLNLGLQSAVFIDDNPREQVRVRDALPEVLVPEWPEDSMLFRDALLSLRCFYTPSISKEDSERAKMYLSEKQRKELKKSVGSLDEWLKGLEITIEIEELNEKNLQRASQLFNKTNQMNLTTRRMVDTELMDWSRHDDHNLWTFRVSDKLGDSGLTGIISLEVRNKTGQIVDFILSCRVIGRKVEETMLYSVIKYARSLGLEKLSAQYLPTPKNKPCLEFWKRSGFDHNESDNIFTWDLKKEYKLSNYIEIL